MYFLIFYGYLITICLSLIACTIALTSYKKETTEPQHDKENNITEDVDKTADG